MSDRFKILIVAGEASADVHGAHVMAAVKRLYPEVVFMGIGGSNMQAQGLKIVADAKEIAVAGLTEVVFAIPRIWRILNQLVRSAKSDRPHLALLLDLPDFNLRLAKKLKKLSIPVVYYISPQIWAWRRGRVEQIRERVNQMLVVLPFEKAFYQNYSVPVQFVGHPLLDELPTELSCQQARTLLGLTSSQSPVVALLPGSRLKEVTRHLPPMLLAIKALRKYLPQLEAIIPVASTIPHSLISKLVKRTDVKVTIVEAQATEALLAADAAVICSGTATLQAALLATPMVVVYRVSWLTYHILRRLVKVAYIALVNLIAQKALVPELVQSSFTPQAVENEIRNLLTNTSVQKKMRDELRALRNELGGKGTADRVAAVIAKYSPKTTVTPQLLQSQSGDV